MTASGWHPPRDLFFSQRLEAIALSVAEIWLTGQSMPVAFLRDGEHWRAMAVFSPGDSANRFVDFVTGQWRAPYIPALMRAYPFRLDDGDPGALKLWPGCAPAPLAEGAKPFVDDAGQPTEEVRRIVQHLRQVHAGMPAVHAPLALLEEWGVLVPWQLEGSDKGDMVLGGRPAFVLDKVAFQALTDRQFLQLREHDALSWLYAQQHSLYHGRHLLEPAPSLEIPDGLAQASQPAASMEIDDEVANLLGSMFSDDAGL